MELKHKKIEELNKKYNTSEACRGVALKGTFDEMIKQLGEKYEEIEEAIERLENSLKTGIPLNEDDIQLYNPDVIY